MATPLLRTMVALLRPDNLAWFEAHHADLLGNLSPTKLPGTRFAGLVQAMVWCQTRATDATLVHAKLLV